MQKIQRFIETDRVLSANVPTSAAITGYPVRAMARFDAPPKTIGELLDRLERVREDLFVIQRCLEQMEAVKPATSDDGNKKRLES